MARADKFSFKAKVPELYSDFLIDFSINPLTGLLARVTNEDSIKQSIRNLVLTSFTERHYHPHTGSKIKTSLMEPSHSAAITLRTLIENTLKQEPRAIIQGIDVQSDFDNYAMTVLIAFTCINIPDKSFTVNLNLSLLR